MKNVCWVGLPNKPLKFPVYTVLLTDFALRRLPVIVFLAPNEYANEEEETKRIPKWFSGIYCILV